jgi:DNA-binding NarL/FixJ family response regulator
MNVALVDEHPVFRTGVRAMLKNQFEDVATVEMESMQSLELVMELDIFNIVIIGLSEEHPEMDQPVLKRIMTKNPLTSFVVYASTPDHKLARSLIRMGVKGYLTKHACAEELVTCVHSVLLGNPYLSPELVMARPVKTKPSASDAGPRF